MKRLSHEATSERRGRVIFPSPHRSLPPCFHCCVAYHAFTVSIAVFFSFAFPPLFFLSLLFVFFCFVFCTSVSRAIELTVRVVALVARFISVVLSPCCAIPRVWFPYVLAPPCFCLPCCLGHWWGTFVAGATASRPYLPIWLLPSSVESHRGFLFVYIFRGLAFPILCLCDRD